MYVVERIKSNTELVMHNSTIPKANRGFTVASHNPYEVPFIMENQYIASRRFMRSSVGGCVENRFEIDFLLTGLEK